MSPNTMPSDGAMRWFADDTLTILTAPTGSVAAVDWRSGIKR